MWSGHCRSQQKTRKLGEAPAPIRPRAGGLAQGRGRRQSRKAPAVLMPRRLPSFKSAELPRVSAHRRFFFFCLFRPPPLGYSRAPPLTQDTPPDATLGGARSLWPAALLGEHRLGAPPTSAGLESAPAQFGWVPVVSPPPSLATVLAPASAPRPPSRTRSPSGLPAPPSPSPVTTTRAAPGPSRSRPRRPPGPLPGTGGGAAAGRQWNGDGATEPPA